MNRLDYAKIFHALGIGVIPLRHRSKEPASNLIGGKWEQYKKTKATEYQINNWLAPDWNNWGVVAGWKDLVIIDFDDMNVFALWDSYYQGIIKKYKVLDWDGDPYMVRTNRGMHVYVTHPTMERANKKLRGIDLKMNGYVVGALSVHPSGAIYRPINNNFYFPTVWDMETLLPPELFPPVAVAEVVEIKNPMVFDTDKKAKDTEYDAFATISTAMQKEDLITKVKQAIRIESLFPQRNKTSADGRWYSVCCPFHDDHNPSGWLDLYRGLFGCETCKMKPMDVINLYARQFHTTESIAVIELAKQIGVISNG